MARKTRKQRGGGGAGGENESRRQRARSSSPVTGIPKAEPSLYNYPRSLIQSIGSLFKPKQEPTQGSPTVYEEIQRLNESIERQGSTDSVLRVNVNELDAIRSSRQNRLTLIGVNHYERGAINDSRAKRHALIDVTPEEIDIIAFVRKNKLRLDRMQHLKKSEY